LDTQPLVDARVPGFAEHVQALREEIAAEEEDGEAKRLTAAVDEAREEGDGAHLRVQVVEGNPRWVVAGSRVEGFLDGGAEDSTPVEILQKAGGHLELLADDRAWGSLRRGATVLLSPQSNATIHRNLLKAFLVVKRRHAGYGDLERADALPPLARGGAVDAPGLRPGQAKALAAAAALPEGGILLVQGPPGTGKTTVIAQLLKMEARRDRTVLVVSHTHVAIDNALRKALAAEPRLADRTVRLGEAGRVSADLAHLNKRVSSFRMDPEEEDAKPLFANLQDKHPIVGMTLDALASAVLAADQDNQEVRPFDTVIVDEAGMNAFPKTALAHFVARRLVLVGDPLQLPPIVRGRRASRDENQKRSHFELLQMLRPDLAVLLDEQFRCHPRIYAWSQDAVYGGRVRSANPGKPISLTLAGHRVTQPVVWLDTTAVPGNKAEQVGTSRANPTHARLAWRMAAELAKQGFRPDELGYITPFRAQAEAFQALAHDKARDAPLARMTAATVDAFQGNERRAILFDLTTLKPAKPHEDHRRLNVSLTRAQELLVILGPRPFVRDPADNPFCWSLQQWQGLQVVPAPAEP
jgi:DNA replication ATP-dependent helicase Dna2